VTNGPNGPFLPIINSVVLVPRNLTQNPISWNEEFYTTAVHEIGHALGLQHTWTSSAMSTIATRATSRARTIDADDVAGITVLYPKSGALAQFGSITGRVVSGGVGVHLASVVAIRPSGSAVSTLTQPDGSYRIDGLPPDIYWIYTHAIPPGAQSGPQFGPGDIVLPLDPNGRPVPASPATETLFYPGTRDPNGFIPIQVRAGAVVNLADLSVQRKPGTGIYDVTTYSYVGQVPYNPAYVNSTSAAAQLVAYGTGLISSGTAPAPGLSVQALGGLGTVNLKPYTPQFVELDVLFPPLPGTGPRHLYFVLPNDAYVLPNGLNLAQKQPPSITAVNPQPDGSIAINGTSLAADSRVFFDSLPALTRNFTGVDAGGTLTVVPPVGFGGQTSSIVVYNSDGQNSSMGQPTPPTFTFPGTGPLGFQINAVTPPTNPLPPGASAMLDITGVNTQFVDGQTTVGIGSSDITVRKVWVLSPTHLWADVVVAPNATPGAYSASVITGFQVTEVPNAFQVTASFGAAGISRPSITLPIQTSAGQSALFAGSTVFLTGTNLSTGAGVTITLNQQPVQVLFATPNQVIFQVPAGTPVGPVVMNFNNGGVDAYPLVLQIDPPPPVIASVVSSQNQQVDSGHPDSAGDIVGVVLQNLDPTTLDDPTRVHLQEGAMDMPALAILPSNGQSGAYTAYFGLSAAITSQQVQLVVTVDGVPSNSVQIAVR
jgi:hypothetical protein